MIRISKGRFQRRLFQGPPSWSSFRRIGSSRLVQSSYVWIALIPILAKMFYSVKGSITLRVFDADLVFCAELPFRWQVLFFASLFLAIGAFLYKVLCPKLIRNYESYPTFCDAGSPSSALRGGMVAHLVEISDDPKTLKIDVDSFVGKFHQGEALSLIHI